MRFSCTTRSATRRTTRTSSPRAKSIDGLLVVREDEAYCQPCLSPVWDTALACHALLEAGGEAAERQARRGLDWLQPRQVLDIRGDWAVQRPDVRPGGWAFQYANPHYPDLDDTAVVVMAMNRAQGRLPPADAAAFAEPIARGREWIAGLQSRDGGFAAFDADNTTEYLNHIPFADHGALLDPPTADVTARCVSMLAQLGETPATSPALARAMRNLLDSQEADGSWFGRWGMNYIYGTWSAPVRAQRGRDRPARASNAPRRRLASSPSRTRTAAGAKAARATGSAMPGTSRPRAPLRRPPGPSSASWPPARSTMRPWRAASPTCRARKARTASGRRSASPQPASRASSTCAITAIRNSSRSGLWRATAT